MSAGQHLTHCPGCESSLIQIDCLRPLGRDIMLVERSCPECGHWEELPLAGAVADWLCEHAADHAAGLEELADRLDAASELWIGDPAK